MKFRALLVFSHYIVLGTCFMYPKQFVQQYLDQSHKLVKQALRYFKTYQPTFCELNEPASLGLVF